MKDTGIVRKMDELGRIVIPREIRKSLKIREGCPLEIYVDKNSSIILKKYAPFGDYILLADNYSETLYKTTKLYTCITDNEKIVSFAGANKNIYLNNNLSDGLIKIIEDRKLYINNNKYINIVDNDIDKKENYTLQIICPIIVEGDIMGSIILFTDDKNRKIIESDLKLIEATSLFISKQMSI